jgi:hypothetical protein
MEYYFNSSTKELLNPSPQGSTLRFCHHSFNHWPSDTYYLWLIMFTPLLEIRVLGKFSVRFQVTCNGLQVMGVFSKVPRSILPNCEDHFAIFLFGYFAKLTLQVSQVHFAKLQMPLCYFSIWLFYQVCQVRFIKLRNSHCSIIMSILPFPHSKVANSTK